MRFVQFFTFSRPATVWYISYCTSSGIELDIPPRYISFVYKPSGSIKHLMMILISKTHYLILNRRTITRSSSMNHARIKRWAIQITSDNLMCLLICIRQPAGNLILLNALRICCEWEWNNSLITFLFLAIFEKSILLLINSRWCSSLNLNISMPKFL